MQTNVLILYSTSKISQPAMPVPRSHQYTIRRARVLYETSEKHRALET